MSKTFRFLNVRGIIAPTLFLLSVFVLLPSAASAQCAHWNVTGTISIEQLDGGGKGDREIDFILTQKGNNITGRAINWVYKAGKRVQGQSADVDGTLQDDDFAIRVYWPGMIGVYTGKISPTGKLDGKTYDEARRAVKVGWFMKGNLACPTPPPVAETIKTTGRPKADPPPPPAKTIKKTGRPVVAEEVKEQPAAPESAVQLRATPNGVLVRAPKTEGKTTVTWSGGPFHRGAELWLKIDDEDEKLVDASPNGSLQANIEPGKAYVYMVKERNRTLATFTVRFH